MDPNQMPQGQPPKPDTAAGGSADEILAQVGEGLAKLQAMAPPDIKPKLEAIMKQLADLAQGAAGEPLPSGAGTQVDAMQGPGGVPKL